MLRFLQRLLLCLLPVVAASTYRHVLWLSSHQETIFYEFRGIVLFLGDTVAIAVVVVSLARLMLEAEYRAHLKQTLAAARFHVMLWGAVVLWLAISSSWSLQPALALYSTFQLGLCLAVALILADLLFQEGEFWPLIVTAAAGAAQGLLAVLQTLNGGVLGLSLLGEIYVYPGGGPYRGNGLSVHPNNLAGFLLISLFACMELWRRGARRLGAGCALLAGAGLLATQSRAGLLAALIALPLAAWQGGMISPALLRRVPRWFVFTALVLASGAVVVFAAQGRLLAARPFHLNDSWPVIVQSPLTGAGASNLMLAIGQSHPQGADLLRAVSTTYDELWAHLSVQPLLPAHNVLLMVWGETGLIGAGLFVAALALSLLHANRVWRCYLLGLCVIGILDYYFWGDFRSRMLLFWVLGMAVRGWSDTSIGESVIH